MFAGGGYYDDPPRGLRLELRDEEPWGDARADPPRGLRLELWDEEPGGDARGAHRDRRAAHWGDGAQAGPMSGVRFGPPGGGQDSRRPKERYGPPGWGQDQVETWPPFAPGGDPAHRDLERRDGPYWDHNPTGRHLGTAWGPGGGHYGPGDGAPFLRPQGWGGRLGAEDYPRAYSPGPADRPPFRDPSRGDAPSWGGHGRSAQRLSVDERNALSNERMAAASEAALEQKQVPEWDSKILANPRADHPIFLIRRFLLTACGGFPEGALSEGSQGEGYQAHLWAVLNDPLGLYEKFARLNFNVCVRHYIAAVRGRLGDLPVGSFGDAPLHERLTQPSPFAQTRPEPPSRDPTTPSEVYRCGCNMAEWLDHVLGPVVGDAFRRFNEECHRLICHQQGFTAHSHVNCLKAALTKVDRNVDGSIARAKDLAAQTGRRLGTGPASLGAWADICLAPGLRGGTVLINPVEGLDVNDPRGVLQTMVRAQKLQLEVAIASLAQQEIDRQRDLAQKELDRLQLEANSADLAQPEPDRQLTVETRVPWGARAKGYPVEETTIQTPALDDRKREPQVPREAPADGSGFAQALDADREKQAALVADRAAAIATAAKATKAAEVATEHAATLEAVVAKQRQFVGELEADHARALLEAEQVAEARWRDRYDASSVEKDELQAQLQAEAGANAALRRERRELRQAGAVTSVRETGETVAAETATAKAGEGRISSRLGRHAVIPESDPGIQFGSGAPAGEEPPLISFGTVDSAPGGASAVDPVGRVPRGSDTPASGTSAISDEPQAKSVTKSAPTSAKPGGFFLFGGAKSATTSAPMSAQPGEDETQGAPTGAKPGKAETQAKSAQKAPRQSPKPNDVKARVTRAKPSAPPGGDKALGERAKPDQAKSAKPSAKPGPIRSGVDGPAGGDFQ